MNIIGLAKWFPFENKFSLGAGPFLGINVATRNIKYTSWGAGKEPAFGTDLQQQQQLRNVLLGKNNFGLAVDLGYDVVDFVKVGARYYWSSTTVFELSVAVSFSALFD